MWLMTKTGFYSITEVPGQPDFLQVRARERSHMDVFPAEHIRHTPARDYEWRVIMPRDEVQQWIAGSVAGIDYNNFKDVVHAARPNDFGYNRFLMNTWWGGVSAMASGEYVKPTLYDQTLLAAGFAPDDLGTEYGQARKRKRKRWGKVPKVGWQTTPLTTDGASLEREPRGDWE